MYLYIPIGGRSIAIGEYIISSTGLQLEELVECLDAELGKQLRRESLEVLAVPALKPPATKTEVISLPQTEETPKI